jgi:hypothetical protein
MLPRRARRKADEFGDFQTPPALASEVCRLLSERGEDPASVVEPTCGAGNLLLAAFEHFPKLAAGVALEINRSHLLQIRASLETRPYRERVQTIERSFFDADWARLLADLPEPILVIGNPPWVTNAELGALGSTNLPTKANFQNRNGLDAVTGKSNFDISEWMLVKLLDALAGRRATLAMLCKTAVARRVLTHAWKTGIGLSGAEIHTIDAGTLFGAAVGACLFKCRLSHETGVRACRVYRRLGDDHLSSVYGYDDDRLIADVNAYDRWKRLAGEPVYRWRSGVKHDCTRVMNLRPEGRLYRNGLGELVELEADFLYPMLKSSEIQDGRRLEPTRVMLVTQKTMGDETMPIRDIAPRTWAYLERHGAMLDRRASTVYKRRPRFAVFGVGEYTFSPWKVAISGFYKKLEFVPIGPHRGRSVVLDDTSYFVACHGAREARYVASLLNSRPAREFLAASIFWDAKRPITIETLGRLDLAAVANELGSADAFTRFLGGRA